MRAEELRIGNFVKSKKDDWITSVQIGTIANCKNYKPINLNEEWLEKFGFVKAETYFKDWQIGGLELIFVFDYYHPIIHQYAELSSEEDQVIGVSRIEYVHQLQNLFFALTGEELTVKELK